MTAHYRILLTALFMAGLGGALLSSSILAGATLLLAVAGGVMIARKQPQKTGWETPKELRLLHFAFWFFFAVSTWSWVREGFDYEGGKTLGTHARLILFWPLVVALSLVGFKARSVFIAFSLVSLSVIIALAWALATQIGSFDQLMSLRFGGGINPISFGNLALLGGFLTLIGGLFFRSSKNKRCGMVLIVLGCTAIVISMLSETRSNLLALPAFMLLLVPLLEKKYLS
ncbi:MAG: glycosyl transferase, partial [Pseudomonadota bacterium]|nr:glycosyl transferase [Pseudomonadota bacterium]